MMNLLRFLGLLCGIFLSNQVYALDNKENISAQIKQISQDDTLSEAQKKQLLTLYEQSQNFLTQQTQDSAQAAEYQQVIKVAPEKTKQLRQRLEKLRNTALPSETDLQQLDLATLNQRLVDKKSMLLSLKTKYDEQSQQLNQIKKDLPITSEALIKQKDQFTKLSETINNLEQTDNTAGTTVDNPAFNHALQAAQKLRLETEHQSIATKIQKLQQNSLSHEARLALTQASVELLQQQIQMLETEVSLQQNIVNQKQEEQAKQIAREIEQKQKTARHKTELEQAAIAENRNLSKQMSDLSQQITQATQEKDRQQRYLQQLQTDFDNLQQQFEIAGLHKNLADIFFQQKKKIPQISRLQQKDVENRQQQLIASRLAQFQLNRAQQAMGSLNQAVQDLLASTALQLSKADREEIEDNLSQILQERQTLFGQLNDMYSQYIKLLYSLDSDHQQLMQKANEYIELLDEKLFWIPNLNPIDWQWIEAFYHAPLPFGSYEQWNHIREDLLPQIVGHPVVLWLWFLLFSSSLLFRKHIAKALAKQKKFVRNVLKDDFIFTLKAIFFSLLLALPWVLFLNGLAWVLLQTEEQQFSHALGQALFYAGMVFFLIEFLRFLCIEEGVFRGHFFWSKGYCDVLFFNLSWFQLLIFPLLFVITLSQSLSYVMNNTSVQETWGRLALFGSCLAIFVLLNLVFRRHLRHRLWLRLLIVAATVLPIGLAFNGFFYTSLSVGIRLFHSSGFVVASLLLYYLVVRWISLSERKLAFEQALSQQRKLYALTDEKVLDVPPVFDVNSISVQARALLRLIVFSFLISGLWYTWVDITPVLSMLDDVVLWHVSSVVDGVEQSMPVTFYDVSFTLVALVVTVLAALNLPGMLELLLLQRLSLPADKRYTIATLTKYLILVSGVLFAAHSLGLRWSQVQWLAAALSVGLGFGLQEIFANFVSGLIILFERPIRIGDMVTVGDINGEVTSIHMRTTIITDRNNKELIVPNKSFITNELINWSLTNTNVRVIIPVGVAYGTDIELVEKLLYEIIKAEPLVLPQYTSRVFFMRFADSALEFEVRVFVSEYVNQNLVRHKINKEIDRVFREHHISIPFPQRDVHVFNHFADDTVQGNVTENNRL